jgi:hypothetical protein
MTLEYIYEAFKALDTVHEKVEYLKGLQKLNLYYDINYSNLIKVWESQAEAST